MGSSCIRERIMLFVLILGTYCKHIIKEEDTKWILITFF